MKLLKIFTVIILIFASTQLSAETKGLTDVGVNKAELLAQKLPIEVVYGDENAPVTMVEYASLSCSHCKKFYDEIFVPIKKKYIDTGKLKLVYRHFPLNYPALRAAMLVQCADSSKKQQKFISALFKTQHEWGFVSNKDALEKKLRIVAKVGGIDDEKFDSCFADKDVEKQILEHQLIAGKELNVKSTPVIFINGKVFFKQRTVESISAAIDDLL